MCLGKNFAVFFLVQLHVFLNGRLPLARPQALVGRLLSLRSFLALLEADLLQPRPLLFLPCILLHLPRLVELLLGHLPLPLLFFPPLIKRLVDQRSSGAVQVLLFDQLLEAAARNLAFLWRNGCFCMRRGRQLRCNILLLFLLLVLEGA